MRIKRKESVEEKERNLKTMK
jgi:hypothetical protein